MNKRFLLIPALTMLLFGCTEDKLVEDNNGFEQVTGGENLSYVNVAIVSNTVGSRADDEPEYKDGTGKESEVENVTFFFFDSSDKAANVIASGTGFVSYKSLSKEEFTVTSPATGHVGVETIVNPVLVIETEDETKIPSKVMAVLNVQSTELISSLNNDFSLANIEKVVKAYANDGMQQFVMSSSVFAKDSKKMVAIDNLKVFKSKEEAEKTENVNWMYVERVNAKVGLINNKLDENQKEGNLYKLIRASSKTTEEGETVAPDEQIKHEGNPIYFKFLGWNVTHDRKISYLVKDINPSWSASTFGWDWNGDTRSFWAVNPPTNASDFHEDYNNGDFRHAQHFKTFSDFTNDNSVWAYPQENAADYPGGLNPATRTKVIIAGQIVNADEEAMDIVHYNGVIVLANNALSNFVDNKFEIYKDGEKTQRLSASDVQFISKQKVAKEWQADGTRYLSCIQLKEADADTKYYDADGEMLTADDVNETLAAIGDFKYYNQGQTYWFTEIEHLGTEGYGDFGVVRNHWYLINLDKLYGLGTPVPDDPKNPDDPEEDLEKIDPEKPVEDNIYVASCINVHSWRVVKQNADLEW